MDKCVEMKRVLVNLTEQQIEELEQLVNSNSYTNRSEALRDAIRLLLEKKKLEELEKKIG
jgi:Arc/MetJ-type ribon-helix-helix transcriptional regulator